LYSKLSAAISSPTRSKRAIAAHSAAESPACAASPSGSALNRARNAASL
jgi:hypothetical protein